MQLKSYNDFLFFFFLENIFFEKFFLRIFFFNDVAKLLRHSYVTHYIMHFLHHFFFLHLSLSLRCALPLPRVAIPRRPAAINIISSLSLTLLSVPLSPVNIQGLSSSPV